jgi:hypothetical protein
MRASCVKNGLVVGVILLFVGVAVQPSVATVEQQKEELVEINIHLCKPEGIENHNVLITRKQKVELDNLIENFKSELDTIETLEEITSLYKNMTISLYELGLFPKDMSLKEVQQLTIEGHEINNCYMEDLSTRTQTNSTEINNVLCLVSGETTYTIHEYRTFRGTVRLIVLLYILFGWKDGLFKILAQYANSHPIIIGRIFGIGLRELLFDYWGTLVWKYYPANGWIHTASLLGEQQIEGDLWGNLLYPSIPILLLLYYNPGILGFIGLRIDLFYIGTALHVKVIMD